MSRVALPGIIPELYWFTVNCAWFRKLALKLRLFAWILFFKAEKSFVMPIVFFSIILFLLNEFACSDLNSR